MNTTSQNIVSNNCELAEKLNDSSIDRVMAIDACWNILAWNKTSEEFSGHYKNDLLGKHLLEIFPAISNDHEMMTAIQGAFEGYKTFLPSSPGLFNRHFIENHFIPLRKDNGEIIGVMNIMHDVAHQVKVEKQLVRLNTALEKKYRELEKANSDLATFTFIAGHDIKEPIRNVYTSLEILARKEGTILSNTSRGNLRKMQASLNRISLLLDDILAIARVGKNNEEFIEVDLNHTIDKVRQKIAEKLGPGIIINSDLLPTIVASSEMINYLFQQLIDNAVKFQDPGNQPVINISSRKVDVEDLPEQTSNFYAISVSDNGIGFDKESEDLIFKMFTRLHKDIYRGSGIGLTICKRIMDAHDGIITAQSTPGSGSTFTCYFPIEEK